MLRPDNDTAPGLSCDRSPGAQRRRLAGALLQHAWAGGWARRPSLDPDALVAAARRHTGLDDFGDGCWRERLDVLVAALIAEAGLNPLGLTIAHGQLVAALANRLRFQALWRRHPDIAAFPLHRPVVIVGQMRSGSTRVQRMLASDPRLTFTRFYESWNPLPRWSGPPLDDRVARAWLALRCAHWLNPAFSSIHPTGTRLPDEEMGLQNVSLYGSAIEAQWRVPSFAAHGERCDPARLYAEFRRMVQTIAWLRRRPPDRPWVLKLPQFGQDLAAVLRAFPDARVVRTTRDPVAVVGSSASLVANQMAMQSDRIDAAWVGREWLRKTALREVRTEAALAAHDCPRETVAFEAMTHDWRGQMRQVYRMLGLALTDAAQARMAQLLASPGQARRARHRYDLGNFGLRESDVRRALGRSRSAQLGDADAQFL